MKSGKRETTEGIELLNQEIIRTFGEKENFKYLGILEVDTIKHIWKKKNSASKEQENFSKQSSAVELSKKKKNLFGNSPCKIRKTILEIGERRTQISGQKDIDTWLKKAWTAIDRLLIIWKSDLTDKMKRSFFQAAVVSILLYGCTTWTLTKRLKKKLDGQLHKNVESNIEQVLAATPHKTPTIRPPASHH